MGAVQALVVHGAVQAPEPAASASEWHAKLAYQTRAQDDRGIYEPSFSRKIRLTCLWIVWATTMGEWLSFPRLGVWQVYMVLRALLGGLHVYVEVLVQPLTPLCYSTR